jgi:hypothetical protein
MACRQSGLLSQRALLCVLLGLASACGCGQRQREDLRRLQSAREAVDNELRSVEQRNDGSPFHEYLIVSLRNASSTLDGIKDGKIAEPIPILAMLTIDSDNRYRFGFQWVEHGFTVKGFYVVAGDGNVTDFPNRLSWDESDEEFYSGTAWRETWFPVKLEENDNSWDDVKIGGVAVRPPIILPWRGEVEKETLRLGLLTDAGRTAGTVDVGFDLDKPNAR